MERQIGEVGALRHRARFILGGLGAAGQGDKIGHRTRRFLFVQLRRDRAHRRIDDPVKAWGTIGRGLRLGRGCGGRLLGRGGRGGLGERANSDH